MSLLGFEDIQAVSLESERSGKKSRQSPQVVVFDKRLEAKAVSLKHMGALK